ncbi:MAG: LuxR C-terminal-related transcriptional regulator [Pseudomonadota bacterium]|nr:LuxR C-terminal-related transcriptional regulator [Pseudomonadota bacterium]
MRGSPRRRNAAIDSVAAGIANDPQYGGAEGALRTHVLRHEPLERLKQHQRVPLVIVRGPAGFGKTTLLRQYSQFRADQGDRIAWARMDAQATDTTQFLRLLCDAVDGFDEHQRQRRVRSDPRPPTLQNLARTLQRIDGAGLVVVDNFEQAFTDGLEGVLAQIVRLLPPGVQLCLGTRVLPGGRLAGLQLREQVVIVDEDELRFRPAESHEFFREFADLSPREIDDIHASTDGWPAALQCYRLCLRRGRRHRSLARAGKGVTSDLIDFLATEVFEHLATDLQAALFDLSVPEKISSSLVEHLTGVEDGEQLIRRIERAGLFLANTDLEGRWYRFHNLFRRFLLARMRREVSEAELRQRHRCVADWYAEHGYREEAIQHAIEAGDHPRALDLLTGVIDHLLAQERLALIERYVDALPVELMLDCENVASAAIIAYGYRRAFDKANRLIEARAQRLGANGDAHARAVHDYAQLFVLAAQDRIQELGERALDASTRLDERDGFQYAVTLNARAMQLCAQSEFEQARGLLLRARPLHDRDGFLFGQAYQEAIYSMTLSAEAHIAEAVRGLGAALRRTEEEAHGSVTAGSVLAMYLADGYYEQNRIPEAETLLNEYGPLAEKQVIVDSLGVMYLVQARIAMNRGDVAAAEHVLERALYVGYQHGFQRLVGYAQAERVRLSTLGGDLDLAERRLREFDVARFSADAALMFHAGETEAHTVTWARLMIRLGRLSEARTELQWALRIARSRRRRRRELKLLVMLALAHQAEGHANLARRALLDALEIGLPRQFVRALLDEGPPALALLRDLRRCFDTLPDIARQEAVLADLDHLLAEAGEPGPSLLRPVAPPLDAQGGLLESLTNKERRLLTYVAMGLSNKDLAERLSVSTNTVKWHLRNIFEKLQINNRMQAVAVARQLGLVE